MNLNILSEGALSLLPGSNGHAAARPGAEHGLAMTLGRSALVLKEFKINYEGPEFIHIVACKSGLIFFLTSLGIDATTSFASECRPSGNDQGNRGYPSLKPASLRRRLSFYPNEDRLPMAVRKINSGRIRLPSGKNVLESMNSAELLSIVRSHTVQV